ncbi:trehalose-6-phosphate synthase [Microbacterium sp. 1.5R]|uniref:alpha,alpha-trehalose-phosphate synthase (UDP-forming) n=1 Tax=Microbacterium TaxID=33882 RepID=UPI0006FB3A81|nr:MULTISPECIES: trehalose-6-phosphate synthase [unclassified Microbacterium]APH44789.1 trehalose-6-phosphate synthase [Microbacterium sp. 1.5R]KRD51993.1 trehalose-phosphate synthase [Microbacterium sp. Root280D1]MBC6494471.1 trehalose-6-phosphate synthase [Microbacterium sp. 4-7]MDY0982598.1 trehalose-6-phosphate synthase [Microbacterium sp. CFBP9023]CAH0154036.1 Trehalose-6-phosphate synthase [Microbacterium sp. Bi98]
MSVADFVVVANRLPVDRVVGPDGDEEWRTSPGGLVAALEPMMRSARGAWVGWAGQPDVELDRFEINGIDLIPVPLSAEEVADYYEGFANDTIWPLYHDVIAPPQYHREWWEAYVKVNRRFAEAAADVVAQDGTVWVHDYQLQLVPQMIRELRPDVTIGYFHHIPFPAHGLYAQLPWRDQVLKGLLGADVIGFQRAQDATYFLTAVRRRLRHEVKGSAVTIPTEGGGTRTAVARAFPISIDTAPYLELAARPDVRARAAEIRASLGNPKKILLGVDRLDYTKGIRHRIKAYGELLEDGKLSVDDVTFVQVASPSRERVDAYVHLRDEIELAVGRINGDHDTMGHTAIRYLHQGYPREEMVALYLAADVMLVTALRDGMNLVAKEYVATRADNRGVLVLSEFTGAADELRQAVRVNPHDIAGLKDAIMTAVTMTPAEQGKRMRSLRRRVLENDVNAWSSSFLRALADVRGR